MTEYETSTGEPVESPVAGLPWLKAEQGKSAAWPATPGDASFGRALAAAREARGLSQSDVAAQLRLHLRQVQAIEAEDLAALPDGPFVRGYLRNYARLVDLPAEPLLALLNGRLKPADPLHADRTGVALSPLQPAEREPRSGRIVVGAVIGALVLLAVAGWWAMRGDRQSAATTSAPPATPSPAAAPSEPGTAVSGAAPAALPSAETESREAAPEATAAPGSASPALRLRFRDRSWVEIRQADGTLLYSQNNVGGTERTVDGTPPFLIVIGNASKVDLEFRGQPVDLSSVVSRDDVARLRLE